NSSPQRGEVGRGEGSAGPEKKPLTLTLTLSRREKGHGSTADACLLPRGSARTHRGAAGEHSSVSLSPRANASGRTVTLEDVPSPAVCGHRPLRFSRWAAGA